MSGLTSSRTSGTLLHIWRLSPHLTGGEDAGHRFEHVGPLHRRWQDSRSEGRPDRRQVASSLDGAGDRTVCKLLPKIEDGRTTRHQKQARESTNKTS